MKQLHASGEDYLEAVLVIQKKKGMVRSVDVARHLDVSRWTEYWHLNCSKTPLVFGNFPSTSRAEKSSVPLQNTRLFPVTPIS